MRHFRYLFHNGRNRNAHDLLLDPLREEFSRDHLNAFHNLLDLRDWHVHSLFSGALLHTLLLGNDLFLTEFVVLGRSRLVHGRNRTNDL